MTFKFTQGPEIGKATNILKGMMGAKEILDTKVGQDYLEKVRLWALQKSATAQRVLKTIDRFPHPVYVVVMKGGFTCFDNEPGPGGVIYMNVDIDLSVRPGGARGVYDEFQKQHPYITFLHECGHAVQNIETPLQFENSAKGPRFALTSAIMDAARKYGERNFGSRPYSERRGWFAPNGSVTGQPWSVRLEYDNIYRHERPICLEAGEPIRDHYCDIRQG